MSGMDKFLAEFYGTGGSEKTASAEDLEKEASVELFMKLASDQNIDLANMPDAQVQSLYTSWVQKAAQAGGAAPTQKTAGEDDDDKKKREEAEKEHGEKKAAAEKIAEADFLGRVMAHAYAQELQKIASGQVEGAPAKTAGELPEAFRKNMEAKKGGEGDEKKDDKEEKKDDKKEASVSKKASAIDELALGHAVKLAQANGFDPAQAQRKVAAVAELGLLGESTKIASAPTVDEAVSIRALEYLEAAGYPVTWNQ